MAGQNGERSWVYSIRLSEDEYAAAQRVADAAHLPASTQTHGRFPPDGPRTVH